MKLLCQLKIKNMTPTNSNNSVKVNYLSRDFISVRTDLINYLKAFFPEQWQDFNVASPGMAMVELNAYVADLLSYTIDKKYNELFLDGVKQRSSVYRMAKTFGYSVPGVRASTTIADISVEVPVTANGPDYNYTPIIRPGMQVKGGGQVFEIVNQIDFSNDFSELGTKNRTIEPILNSNEDIIKYRLLKREIVKAGITYIYKKEVLSGEEKPFFQITLPKDNVLEVVSVIIEVGVGLSVTPSFSDFEDFAKKYWEVDYLATDKVFIEDGTSNGTKIGRYLDITKRFTKEFMSDGTCKLTFGGGIENFDAFDDYLTDLTNDGGCMQSTDLTPMSLLLNPDSLGEIVPGNHTIYVKYRAGGGSLSNIGSNVLQATGGIKHIITGSVEATNQETIGSIRANNPIPALGGRGLPTIAEIKNHIASNFAAQKRCVTLEDYVSRCYQLPGKFGAPFRIQGEVNDNKVILYILSLNGEGKLNDISTTEMKNNIVRYLTPYRMINDFVEINDGRFVNLGVQVDLFVDNAFNSSEVKLLAINRIKEYMDIKDWHMNQPIYVSQITDELREIPGVINVVEIRFYNLDGGVYSSAISPQALGNRTYDSETAVYTTEIIYIDNAIQSSPLSMFEIRFPEKDIKIRIATGNER